MNRTTYDYWLDGDVLAIKDLGGPETVTKHIGEILSHIEEREGSLVGKYVIYEDTDGIWDAVVQTGDELCIYPLGGFDFHHALSLLRTAMNEYILPNTPSETICFQLKRLAPEPNLN